MTMTHHNEDVHVAAAGLAPPVAAAAVNFDAGWCSSVPSIDLLCCGPHCGDDFLHLSARDTHLLARPSEE